MNVRRLVVVTLLLIGLGTGAGYWYTSRAHSGDEGSIHISGNIEVTDAEVSFKLPGRVIERLVDEGQRVTKGHVVARLDPSDLQWEVAARKAELAGAQDALRELQNGSRPEEIAAAKAAAERARWTHEARKAGSRDQEIRIAEHALAAATVERDRARDEYQRNAHAFEQKSISAEVFNRYKATFEVALERYREAAQQLSLLKEGTRQQLIEQAYWAWQQAKAEAELVEKGPRSERIEQGKARVAQAQAALNLANTRLADATLQSPLDGVVLSKSIEPGEYVSPGTPVVTVADLANVWLRGYVDERDLGRVTIGQKARVTTDTYPDKAYEGRVSFISSEAEFTPKTVQTNRERVKLVYRIKIDIVQDPKLELLPGMPADAEILVGSSQ